MPRPRYVLGIAVFLILGSTPAWGQQAPKVRLDCFGDPLPDGAVARLGSIRFRQREIHLDASVAFSPDGKLIAVTFADGKASGVHLLEVPSGREVLRLEVPGAGRLGNLTFSPDGKYVGVTSGRRIFFWDTAPGKHLGRFLQQDDDVSCFAFLPDGKTVALGCGRAVSLWDANSGEAIRRLGEHESDVKHLTVSKDGKQLISWSTDQKVGEGNAEHLVQGTICVWASATGKLVSRSVTDAWWVTPSSDGRRYVATTGHRNRQVREREGCKNLFPLMEEEVHCAFSTDGRLLAVSKWHELTLLESSTGKEVRTFPNMFTGPFVPCLSADNRYLAVCGGDRDGHTVVRLWDVASGKELLPTGGHREGVPSVALSPDGKVTASASRDGTVRLWETRSGKEIRALIVENDHLTALAISPDGKAIAAGGETGTVHVWEFDTGKLLHRLQPEAAPGAPEYRAVGWLAFTPEGKRLVANELTNLHRVYTWPVGKLLWQGMRAWSVGGGSAISPSGQLVASIGWEDEEPRPPIILLWDLETGKIRGRIPVAEGGVFGCPVFSADGKCLAFASGTYYHPLPSTVEPRVRVLELATRQEIVRFETPRMPHALRFSPNDETLLGTFQAVWWHEGSDIHLWHFPTGMKLGRVAGHLSTIHSLAFTRDGKTLVTGSADSTVLVWDTRPFPRHGGIVTHTRDGERGLEHWEKLNGPDAAAAYRAIWELSLIPDTALSLLRDRVRPVPPTDQRHIARLVDSLNADQFDEREKATAELGKLAELAEPALRKALAAPASAEVRRRVSRLLEKLEIPVLSGAPLQAVRVTALLERMNTPEARRFLEELAKGEPAARLTREAKASLERLAQRAAAAP